VVTTSGRKSPFGKGSSALNGIHFLLLETLLFESASSVDEEGEEALPVAIKSKGFGAV